MLTTSCYNLACFSSIDRQSLNDVTVRHYVLALSQSLRRAATKLPTTEAAAAAAALMASVAASTKSDRLSVC